jgi:hypothetical protein
VDRIVSFTFLGKNIKQHSHMSTIVLRKFLNQSIMKYLFVSVTLLFIGLNTIGQPNNMKIEKGADLFFVDLDVQFEEVINQVVECAFLVGYPIREVNVETGVVSSNPIRIKKSYATYIQYLVTTNEAKCRVYLRVYHLILSGQVTPSPYGQSWRIAKWGDRGAEEDEIKLALKTLESLSNNIHFKITE